MVSHGGDSDSAWVMDRMIVTKDGEIIQMPGGEMK